MFGTGTNHIFGLLSLPYQFSPFSHTTVWENLTDKNQPLNYHSIIASIYTQHVSARGLTTCFSFSQQFFSNMMPITGINYTQLDLIISSRSMLWTTTSIEVGSLRKSNGQMQKSLSTSTRSWPAHFLDFVFNRSNWSYQLQGGFWSWQSTGLICYSRAQESHSPDSQLLRGWVHPPPQKFLNSLSFHVDLILSALSHCNAHWFRLAFYIYAAHLQSLSSCHLKAIFCAS